MKAADPASHDVRTPGSDMPHVLLLTRYQRLGAASRVRFLQFLPFLDREGFTFDILPLLDDDYIRAIYQGGRPRLWPIVRAYGRRIGALLSRRKYDFIWIEKEALPWLPAWLEAVLLSDLPYVVDIDDAWFLHYDSHRSMMVRGVLGGKIAALFQRCALAIVGNAYLADYARRVGAPRVELIPSTIDLVRYTGKSWATPDRAAKRGPIVIGWIGTPVTAPYLSTIEPALRAVLSAGDSILHVIGAPIPAGLADLPAKSIAWDEITEVEEISRFDIGIMPLPNDDWAKGKCGYKLLQVMAAARPVIGSALGANLDIVQNGQNGFLAGSPAEWRSAFERLIGNAELRTRIGEAGRRTVEQRYALAGAAERLATVLRQAMRGRA